MKRQFHLLLSPAFIFGLLLLLANEFIFKTAFHNALTGKLSDVAGLFIFPIFWTAFAPARKRAIYLLTALGFIFWKSVYAQSLIDSWNELRVFDIGRTVDITDLLALAVLPFSYLYSARQQTRFLASPRIADRFIAQRIATCGIILISVFAFTATQRQGDHMVSEEKEYEFQISRDELLDRLNKIGLGYVNHYRTSDEAAEQLRKIRGTPLTEEERNQFSFKTPTKLCNDTIHASVTLHARGDKAVLKINYLVYNCDKGSKEHEQEAIRIFEKDVIDKLRADLAARPD
jgi:hypothetical protein